MNNKRDNILISSKERDADSTETTANFEDTDFRTLDFDLTGEGGAEARMRND